MPDQNQPSVLLRDLTGKSFLEIGRTGGLYCVGAIELDAEHAATIAFTDEEVELVQQRAQQAGISVPCRHLTEDPSWTTESYDEVLCIDALPHVRHPFQLLDHLVDVTSGRLTVEVCDFDETVQKKNRLNWWRRLLLKGLRGYPIVFVSPNSLRSNRQHFYLSVEAVRQFLAEHRQTFCNVRVIPSPNPGKKLVIAEKRKIRHLVIIAGPTSAGKSTLIEKIEHGQMPELYQRIGIESLDAWESKDLYPLARDPRPVLDRVILHYDFTTRLKWNIDLDAMTDLVDVVGTADQVTFVTLWTEPEQLLKQFEENEIQRYLEIHGKMTTNTKTLRLREDYQDPGQILRYYRDWFRFTEALSGTHYVVSQRSELMSVQQWRQNVDASSAGRE